MRILLVTGVVTLCAACPGVEIEDLSAVARGSDVAVNFRVSNNLDESIATIDTLKVSFHDTSGRQQAVFVAGPIGCREAPWNVRGGATSSNVQIDILASGPTLKIPCGSRFVEVRQQQAIPQLASGEVQVEIGGRTSGSQQWEASEEGGLQGAGGGNPPAGSR